jgi:hypothetical protein
MERQDISKSNDMRLFVLVLCLCIAHYSGSSQIEAIPSPSALQANPELGVVCSTLRPVKGPLRESSLIVDYSNPPVAVEDAVPVVSPAVEKLPEPIPCLYAMAGKPEPEEPIFCFNAERMPYLKACAAEHYAEQRKCTGEKLLAFIYNNLVYPEGRKPSVEKAVVVVQFVIESDGNISDEVKVVRDIGPPFSAEALRIVDLLRCTRGMEWMPGTQYNKPVAVRYNLPIKFKPGGGNPYP